MATAKKKKKKGQGEDLSRAREVKSEHEKNFSRQVLEQRFSECPGPTTQAVSGTTSQK